MSSWYQKWFPEYSAIADPLINLTRKSVKFLWDEKCQLAFDTLKQKLICALILSRPEYDLEFILETDASNTGLGCVFLQRDKDNKDRVIAYTSRVLSAAERKFSTANDDVKSGHLGQKKSYWRASALYFWPGLHKDVVKYIKACYTCQQ